MPTIIVVIIKLAWHFTLVHNGWGCVANWRLKQHRFPPIRSYLKVEKIPNPPDNQICNTPLVSVSCLSPNFRLISKEKNKCKMGLEK